MKTTIDGQVFEGTVEEIAEITKLLKIPAVFIPQFTIRDRDDHCEHTYPEVWHSILPPACLKCGYVGHSPIFTYTPNSNV